MLCHKTLALSSRAETWNYRHPCETYIWTNTPPCQCIRALWSEWWWIRSHLDDVASPASRRLSATSRMTQKASGSVVSSKAAFFCRFVTFHLILQTMQRHTIRRHLLRNIFEINLALNMLELHVIPERPVTFFCTTASAYRALDLTKFIC